MAELNQQQVIDYIKGISVLELSQLVKALESELGVSAAAAMPMAMPGVAGGGGAGITIGPILLGASRPVHILTPSATVRRIINMTAVAVVDSQETRKQQIAIPFP